MNGPSPTRGHEREGLPLLDLSGPPRAMGRAQGEAARERVRHNVALYFHRFEADAEVPRAEALERGLRYFHVIEGCAPDYAAMVRGLAEASGHTLAELAALNARYEIMYSEFSRSVVESGGAAAEIPATPANHRSLPGGGCTSFVALPDATPDSHLRLGENWDWIPGVQGLLLRLSFPDGLRVLCFTEAGIAGGKIGLNSAGVGLAINGLSSNLDGWERLRTPFHVRTWRALTSRSLAEAHRAILGEARSCAANFLVAQAAGPRAGSAVNVEAAPLTAATIEVERGALAHANHFLQPEGLDIWEPIDARSSTFHRGARMQRLLDEHASRLGDETLASLLRDHDGYPESVCNHQSPRWPPDERYETVFSTIMDLHAGTLLAAGGTPCTHAYRRVEL